jgi:hypothetical protein
LRTLDRLAALTALVALLAACGARGAPRPPLRIVPDTVRQTVATRLGDRVYLEFAAPDRDTDGTTPGDIGWIEVYAVTTQPTRQRPVEEFSDDWLDVATLVAVLPVRAPEAPPSHPLPELDELLDDVQNRDAVAGPVAFFEIVQGAAVTVVERLTPEALVPVTVGDPEDEEEDEEDEDEPGRILPMPLVSPPIPPPPIRSYVAFAVSSRGRLGDPSGMVAAPLVTPPSPPGPSGVTYTATSVEVAWEEPPTFRLPVQEAQVEPPALQSSPVLPGLQPSQYVVYDVAASGDPDVERPLRLGAPVSEPSYIDSDVTLPDTRCYEVRVLDRAGELDVLGDPSPATCVVLTDTFPPVAPTGLIAVADTTGISLVWDDNAEADLAGYLVLRGTAADATLQPLTVEPIVRTAYQDTDVVAGERYFYRVLAVDTAVPPNASPPSEAVTDIAR